VDKRREEVRRKRREVVGGIGTIQIASGFGDGSKRLRLTRANEEEKKKSDGQKG